MREILFRGKSIDTGRWVYGDIQQFTKKHLSMGEEQSDEAELILIDGDETDISTVGQYTGLLDCNGMKIFEDDIVKDTLKKKVFCITFCQGGFYLDRGNDCPCDLRNNGLIGSQNNYYIKVTGNIHDTPELLQEGV